MFNLFGEAKTPNVSVVYLIVQYCVNICANVILMDAMFSSGSHTQEFRIATQRCIRCWPEKAMRCETAIDVT